MKKTILSIFILAITASIGYGQKNIILHQNTGNDYKTTTMGVDSITFQDFATPGTLTFDSYNDPTIVYEAHSKVKWAATYKGDYMGISGAFNKSDADMLFDEANPSNIKFDGKVDLSTVNTFEPGREGPGKCTISNIGVVWTGAYQDTTYRVSSVNPTGFDTIIKTSYDPDSLVDATNWATLVAAPGSVTAYGDGYLAQATFTFRGVSATVPVYIKFIGIRGNATKWYYCFEANFQFQAGSVATDPFYCGTSIKSMVNVTMQLQYTDVP